jgi:ribosomal subunit interface protein
VELRITGRHHQVDRDVQDYAREKLGGLEKYNQRAHRIEVILDVDEQHRIVLEAKALIHRGPPIVVHERHRNAKGAIDLAHDALERGIRKEKERARDRHRPKDGAAAAAPPASARGGAAEEE